MKRVSLFLANGCIAVLVTAINMHPVSLQQLLIWQRKISVAIYSLRIKWIIE